MSPIPLIEVKFLWVAFWVLALPADGVLQFGDALIEAANLLHQNLQLQIHQQVDLRFQNGLLTLLATQRFFAQV